MSLLSIGQVAEEAGVGVETVRFYERKGLLEEPQRKASGYRQFDEQAVHRIRFIRRAKELGFTLKEISGLLELRLDPSTTCAEVKQRADSKIEDIEERIRSLQKMKKALGKLSQACAGQGSVGDCPILESLDGQATAPGSRRE